MFDMCKKVNVYNIENHYHYYPASKDLVYDKPIIHFSKLCPKPISTISRKNKAPGLLSKKGIKLAKNIPKYKPPSKIQIKTIYP